MGTCPAPHDSAQIALLLLDAPRALDDPEAAAAGVPPELMGIELRALQVSVRCKIDAAPVLESKHREVSPFPHFPISTSPLRLSELVATFALALDNAFGQPLGPRLRSRLLAVWMWPENLHQDRRLDRRCRAPAWLRAMQNAVIR
jgi:hypothetical protein